MLFYHHTKHNLQIQSAIIKIPLYYSQANFERNFYTMPRFNRLSDAADSARTNNLSFKFGKFDLAFTVSEEYLNKTLKSMWAMGGLPTTLTMEDKSKGGIVKTKMVAECGPTRISLDGVDSQSGRKEIFQDGSAEVLVTIPVLSGTYVSGVYDFDKGKVVYMKRTLGPNDGVIISYVVKLDIGSVASGIDTKGFQLTKEVKDQTDSWSNEMFDPHYLYMNFEDPNIIGSFKIASNAPLDGSTGTEAIKTQDALATSYLNESKKKNSFVFAAIKVAKDKRANSFNLTGATFSIDRKSPHPYQRSLSYLFVTGEEPAPSAVGNFSYSSGDKGGYLTTFHLPARMYYNPRKFIDVIQTSVFNKMKADTKYKNLKNGGDGITFNVVVDDDNTVEGTIKLRLAAGTQDVYMDTRVTTKVPQKFLFINTNADVTYWKEMGYKSTMTLDDKTKSGLKISNFVEVGGSEREGNNMTTGQIVLKAMSFLNLWTAVSQIIQLVNDAEGDAAVDSVSASSNFNMLGHNIVMPGQDKLIFKGFGINPHGVPNIQALYNLKRPLEEESAHRIPDGIVNIRSASSHNYLDGRGARSTGTDKLFLTNRSPAGDTYLQWEIIPYGETFALRSVSSGNYLDGRGPGMTGLHQVALTNRSPDGDTYLQWEVVPYGETFALRSVSSRNYLDGRDPADTGPQVALTNRIPDGDIYLQWEITSAVGIGSETTPAVKRE